MNSGVYFGFLQENVDFNDVRNPLSLNAGTKVFYKIINRDSEEINLTAYSDIHEDGNTEFEVIIPINPPIAATFNILRPPEPPPSPPPSPGIDFLLRL